ncbi:MAG TPA: hypothetical protein VLF66_01055, partial [Thermoanaerobaculia bacterium]|nr:hypothetical protein [Thermoanaerobaculia bacterium]
MEELRVLKREVPAWASVTTRALLAVLILTSVSLSLHAGWTVAAEETTIAETAYPLLIERVRSPRTEFFVYQDADSGL